ncbi:hypothetical protein JCM3770_007365 [Rhodotorula araucariae]
MALFLDRRSGWPVTTKLKEVSLPLSAPAGYPVYELDESDSASEGSTARESDDDLFVDAVEDQPAPKGPVVVPEEVLEMIFEATQRWGEDAETLRSAALVCTACLFGQTLYINSPNAAKRLRRVVDARPELRSVLQHVDLASPCSAYDVRMTDVFRRLAGVLRVAGNVKTLSLLHVPLSDKVRRKFFAALQTLPMEEARLFSAVMPNYGRFAPQRRHHGTSDVEVLPALLQKWPTLKRLTLSGYSTYPRLFSAALLIQPVPPMPSYRLTELSLVTSDLSSATLLWLLGDSLATLRTLNLSACSGLSADILGHLFSFVGLSLENLNLAMDLDDLHASSSSAPLDSAILAPLKVLTSFQLSTDTLFGDNLLLQLVTLPALQSASLCFPSFDIDLVKRALATLAAPPAKPTLRHLTLDAWESHELWSEAQRWEVLQACEAHGVELVMNGMTKEDIEEEWYGEDMADAWRFLERPEPRGPTWASSWGTSRRAAPPARREMRPFALLGAALLLLAGTTLAAPFPQAGEASTPATTSTDAASLDTQADSNGCVTYDGDGFAPDGYDRAGYGADGLDKDGYGKDGFNEKGVNRDGLDKSGKLSGMYALDANGFDEKGFNLAGLDKDGYNHLGYDKDGYNRKGYDRNDALPPSLPVAAPDPLSRRVGYDRDNRDRNGARDQPPELSDQMGPLPVDTAAFVGDAYASETGPAETGTDARPRPTGRRKA